MSRQDLFRKVFELCADTVAPEDLAAIDEAGAIAIRCRGGKVLILVPRDGGSMPGIWRRVAEKLPSVLPSISGAHRYRLRSVNRAEALLALHYRRPVRVAEMASIPAMVEVVPRRSTYPIIPGGEACHPVERHPCRARILRANSSNGVAA